MADSANIISKVIKSKGDRTFKVLLAILATIPIGLIVPAKLQAQTTVAQFAALDKNVIYVNSRTGNDSDSGEKFSPLKTVTQALKIAAPGVTIKLAAGTYSVDTGETFPLIVDRQITLQGNPDNQGYQTIIEGHGDFNSPTGAGQSIAIAALKDAAGIIGLKISNQDSRGHGLWVESANLQIANNTFTRNGNTGLSVNGNSSPTIENNYFYNNSGNGLLVYGTSQPQVIDNTFEKTGFGVSIIEKAAPTLIGNKFDGNRIGIILEGNSQAVLKNNEVINSQESGLTAIANSQVNLGTSSSPGNNTFRSNRKLAIQNATSNSLIAVGTEVQGQTAGDINFDSGEFTAVNNLAPQSTLSALPNDRNIPAKNTLPPLPSDQDPVAKSLPPLPEPTVETTANPSLPAPPVVNEENKSNKELIFTPSGETANASSAVQVEPVPFPPAISNSALSSTPVKYKVLVEAIDERAESEVRSLYPQAFRTVFEGQSLLQIGAFNSRDKAKQAEGTLSNLGLSTFLLE